jgi:molybdenum cofactor cytidylyltransferase
MTKDIFNPEEYVDNMSAIILAGGYSQRMNDFKPLLPLGNSTVVENTVKVFLNAGIQDVTVVVGHRAPELKAALDHVKIKWVYNERFSEGMYSSVVAGVNSLRPDTEGFFLLPADMPLVKSGTVSELLKVYFEKKCDIAYPVFNGKRGHPPFISARLFEPILAWNGSGGLRVLLEQYQNSAQYVEVQDEGILTDIDTPEDYSNLCKLFKI